MIIKEYANYKKESLKEEIAGLDPKPHFVITDVDDRDYVSLLVKMTADNLPVKRK